jgi:hypothetical protein
MPKKVISFSFMLLMIAASAAFAGWTPDVQLTHRNYEIEARVIANNDTVHIAWYQISGDHKISYIRSIDGGNYWYDIKDLTGPGHRGITPDLSLSQGRVLIGWPDEDTNPVNWAANVGYSISLGGAYWPAPSYVFDHWDTQGERIAITLDSNSIFMAYMPMLFDSAGNQLILFKYSTDLGSTWSDSQIVGRTSQYANGFDMRKCGNSIYIVWSGVPMPSGYSIEVIKTVSHDGGRTWSNMEQLSSPDSAYSQHSCMACDETTNNLAVGWMDYAESHVYPGDLYLRITTDGGYSWGEELQATHSHTVAFPSMAIAADSLWAVWQDVDWNYGIDNPEIAFTKSIDFGQTWISRERLTYAPGFSNTPCISYDHGKLHVVWYEQYRPPDSTWHSDIYYKRYEPDVGIGDDGEINLPDRIILSAYPNPFNSSVLISYSSMKGGDIGIYDIKGQLIRTLIVEGGSDGKINWDANDAMGNKVCSGIYFARAKTSQSSQVVKLIYLK